VCARFETDFIDFSENVQGNFPEISTIHPLKNLIAGLVRTALNNKLAVDQGLHTHSTSGSYTRLEFNNSYNNNGQWATGHDATMLYDGNDTTYAVNAFYGALVDLDIQGTVTGTGTPIRFRFCVLAGATDPNYDNPFSVACYISGSVVETIEGLKNSPAKTWYSGWHTITSWASLQSPGCGVRVTDGDYDYLYAVYLQVDTGSATISYDPASGVALAGDLILTGTFVSNLFGAGKILADMTADSTAPVDACSWILNDAGLASASVAGSLAVSAFNGVIQDYQTALYWLNLLAFQCGAWFAMFGSSPKLISRSGSGSSKTIPAVIMDDTGRRALTRQKTNIADLINKIAILYNRDWTQAKGSDAYQATASGTTGDGLHERPDLFMFDFITSSTDAAALATLYLSLFGTRKWMAVFYETLEHSEMEFGDSVVMSFLGQTGVLIAAEHDPGTADAADQVILTAVY
jgi:hypothetical protein